MKIFLDIEEINFLTNVYKNNIKIIKEVCAQRKIIMLVQ